MELLEKYFDIAFNSKIGIEKLRSYIFSIALKGDLVPQYLNENAQDELEKANLIKEDLKKKKQIKIIQTNPISENETPYNIPQTWRWVRLANVGEINPRNNFSDIENAGFVPMPLIFSDYSFDHKYEVKKWRDIKKAYTHFANNDIGLAKITPCFENGKSCVFKNLPNGIGAGTTELHIFRDRFNLVYPDYLLIYFKSSRFIINAIPNMTGSAGQKRIPTTYFANSLLPLPPLEEQKRIVTKINELMASCDEMERLKKNQEEKQLKVNTAALHQLLESPDRKSFQSILNFITNNFSNIYSVKDNVEELKKAILQLAMQGKLVAQDPKDQPASELLKEIQAEKEKLVKEGKIKKQKPLPEIKSEEIPYELPVGWVWCRLGEICYVNGGYAFKSALYQNQGVRILRISDFDENGLKYDKIVRYKSNEKLKGFELTENTVIMAMTGGTVGKTLFIETLPEKIYVNQRVVAIKASNFIIPIFIYYQLRSETIQRIIQKAKNSTNDNISMNDIVSFKIPLPPLEEQQRIVAKINELMALCNGMIEKIEKSEEKQENLLQSVLAGV